MVELFRPYQKSALGKVKDRLSAWLSPHFYPKWTCRYRMRCEIEAKPHSRAKGNRHLAGGEQFKGILLVLSLSWAGSLLHSSYKGIGPLQIQNVAGFNR